MGSRFLVWLTAPLVLTLGAAFFACGPCEGLSNATELTPLRRFLLGATGGAACFPCAPMELAARPESSGWVGLGGDSARALLLLGRNVFTVGGKKVGRCLAARGVLKDVGIMAGNDGREVVEDATVGGVSILLPFTHTHDKDVQ